MMTAPLPPSGSRIGRLSSWFGGSAPAPGRQPDRSPPKVATARREAARDLFARIGAFLDRHDLAPTVDHFRIARSYVLGEDDGLNRAIDAQVRDRGSIDPAFLAGLALRQPGESLSPDRIAEMADALAARLTDSERTFRQSHASARDYETALTAEADAIEGDTDGTVKRLLALTTEAIERTQQLAGRLQQTHQETDRLRSNLRDARRAADEDHLTALPNRRCFDGRMQALMISGPDPSIHCAALCDIDDFKAINDRHGHDTGDRVLKLIARQLTAGLGVKVLVARHGGEEFACLFRNCPPEEALALLDGVRESLGARTLVNQASGEGIGRITFSAGIAVLHGDAGITMRAADAALYAAKRQGKNRVLIAGDTDPDPAGG
jgi:diguanylate cyclase